MNYEDIVTKIRSLGLFIQDLENNRAYPNNFWESWGYTEEEMVRYGFLSFVHPEDRSTVEETIASFNREDRGFQCVFRIIDKKGNWRWILSSCLAVKRDDQGNVLQYVGFDQDISEEMEAKARAEKALKEAETLISANKAIMARLDLPHTISAILEQAGRVISFDSSSVQLLESRDGAPVMNIVGGIGFPEEGDIIGTSFPLTGFTPNARIMEEKELLVLNKEDIDAYSDFGVFAYSRIKCWMGVPLVCGDRLLGMISFDRLRNRPFTNDDIRLARAFSGQVSLALYNSQLYEETRKLAITDPLTGCFSRRWMYSELEKLCESSLRHSHELSLIMFDIDDFKLINDSYGHLTGDEVLKKITQLTLDLLRKSDLLCRVGGEEFIILLPYEGRNGAVDVAERIRAVIEKESALPSMSYSVTVSLGCTQFQPSDYKHIDELIGRADGAMYKSKQKGKNRVSFL
ncbi:MAG: diguanylate cyclase [Spirochaetales bacterium]|nr:diguanylate cyclase [Spirochaetales bacterium]